MAEPIADKRLQYIFNGSIGYAKTKVSLLVLSELGLISLDNGIYSVVPQSKKTDLMASPVYKMLKGGDGN